MCLTCWATILRTMNNLPLNVPIGEYEFCLKCIDYFSKMEHVKRND